MTPPPRPRIRKDYRLFRATPTEREALKADIAERGVLNKIEVDEKGNVLDGHQRLEICRELGIKPAVVVRRFSSEHEKVNHIVKVNLLHRDPGPITWARAVERLLEARGVERGQGSSARKRWSQSATVADIAAELGVAERTLRHNLSVAERLADRPELAERVELGELSVRAALVEAECVNVAKPDLGDGISHPARYSGTLLPVFAEFLRGANRVLDPFAGTGRIHELEQAGYDTVGVEIEPEWAEMHPRTRVGDALSLEFDDRSFHAICTSPTYGNRYADHHDAKDPSTRRSYRHDLGRPLHKNNSGRLQWGPAYRELHVRAWKEALRALCSDGLFVLNIKDHIRKGKHQHVAGWHVTTLCRLGLTLVTHREVRTVGMRAGENADDRFPEIVYLFKLEVNDAK